MNALSSIYAYEMNGSQSSASITSPLQMSLLKTNTSDVIDRITTFTSSGTAENMGNLSKNESFSVLSSKKLANRWGRHTKNTRSVETYTHIKQKQNINKREKSGIRFLLQIIFSILST